MVIFNSYVSHYQRVTSHIFAGGIPISLLLSPLAALRALSPTTSPSHRPPQGVDAVAAAMDACHRTIYRGRTLGARQRHVVFRCNVQLSDISGDWYLITLDIYTWIFQVCVFFALLLKGRNLCSIF